MKRMTQITSLQLYLMLFLSQAAVCLTVNSQTLGEGNFSENIFSFVLGSVVLSLPVLSVLRFGKKYPELSLPAAAERYMGGFGHTAAIIYAICFVLTGIHSLSLFLTLVVNTMDPAASRWSIVLVLMAIALYGAVKGIETVSRASILIFTILLIGVIGIAVVLVPAITPEYAEPVFSQGTGQMTKGFWTFIVRCTFVAELAVFLPFAKGRKKTGYLLFCVGSTVFFSLLIFLLVFCLGKYASLQIFPVYTLATMAEIAGIQRLDALLIGLSMMVLVIRLSSGLFAVSECTARMLSARGRVFLLVGTAVVIAAAALWITEDSVRTHILFHAEYLLPVAVMINVILPYSVILAVRMNRKKVS